MINSSRRYVRSILAAGACLAIVLPSAASAETFSHRDPAHDVVRQNQTTGVLVKTPANKSADIIRVRFSHTRRHVLSMTAMRDYQGGYWMVTEVLKTPRSRYVVWGTMWHGDLSFQVSRNAGDSYRCRGITGTIRPARDQILVSVPTRCIARPRWVRMGLYYSVIVKGGASIYIDNALRKGFGMNSLDLSPRLRRG